MTDLYNRAKDIAKHTTTAEKQRQLSIDRDIVRFKVIYGLLGKLRHGKQPIVTISGYTNKQNIISALENVYGDHMYDIFKVINKSIVDDCLYVYLKEDWFTLYVPTGPRKIKVPNQVLWFKYMSPIDNPKLNAADRLYYLLRDLGNRPDDILDDEGEAKLLTVAAEQNIDKGKTQREGFDGLGKFIMFSKLYWYNPWFFIIKDWAESQLNVSFIPTVNGIWELKIYEEGIK